jgi:hypothetical protein
MPFATSTLNKFLEAAHGKTTYTAPGTFYIALCTSAPTSAGALGAEPSGNGYARVAITGSTFGAASGGSITNTALIQFATATGSGWGTITHFMVTDSATVGAGALQFWGTLTSQSVPANVAPYIAVGGATSTLT